MFSDIDVPYLFFSIDAEISQAFPHTGNMSGMTVRYVPLKVVSTYARYHIPQVKSDCLQFSAEP